MTLEELTAEVTELRRIIDLERRERAALERIVIPPVHEVREGLSLLERNVELSLQHIVERITEAAASGDGDIRAVTEAMHTLLEGMVNLCLEQASKQTLISIKMLAEVMTDGDKVLADRATALERRFRLLELFLNARFVPEAA